MVTPCNMHIDKLALEAENGANEAGGKAIIFNTITISDGISMGTEGMKYSLVSREVIADSIETVVGCEGMDGFVAIGGCDKNMPGCIIAMARLNRPAVFVYGGTILPGCITGTNRLLRHRLGVRSRGQHANGKIERQGIRSRSKSCAIPGPGSCGGMYTANTMASAIEALGHEPAQQLRAERRFQRQDGRLPPRRRGRGGHAQARHQPARHHDAESV